MKEKRRTETRPVDARIAQRPTKPFRELDGARGIAPSRMPAANGRRGWMPAGTTGTKKAVTSRHGS
ncbi:hypothetical protein C5615_03080 [Burkholderia cepacia]|uniref:Uncharacterized protein n=1 Tax=Burkholderia cepacia TaxID=292 RepID=A0A2S8J4G3_BURCE|nr:hypothetical protein C5615_03080 [Burkholderia cepacia]